MKQIILGVCASLLAIGASAKDLGVQGTLWPIVEQDIREMMVESAAKADWSKTQSEIKKQAESYLDRLPKRQLARVDKTETVYFDPSIVLTSDIQVPVKQADETYRWQVMAPKGTRFNPLEHTRPATAMLFFDGADEDQLKLIQAVLAKEPDRIVPVETGGGSLKAEATLLNRAVFHANDAMLQRFQVKHLPSLVRAGSGEQRLYMSVTSFGAPFSAVEVVTSWPELAKPSLSQPTAKPSK